MKGKKDEETKYWIGWLVSNFCKRNGLKGRREGRAQIE